MKVFKVLCLLLVMVGCSKKVHHEYEGKNIPLGTLYVTLEYGDDFDPSQLEFEALRNAKDFEIDTVDTYHLGEYVYEMKLDGESQGFVVNVVDTHDPIIDGEATLSVELNSDLDLTTKYHGYDVVDGDLNITASAYDTSVAGTQWITLRVEDKNGRYTTQEIKLIVKDKVVIEKKPDAAFYVDGHVIVNKKYGLPDNFATAEDPVAYQAVKDLIAEMKSIGYAVDSSVAGYRTYDHQEYLYTNYVKNHGQAAADISSAKPGHSEHQTGLAFDLRSPSGALLKTEAEILWVKENAHRFGFIVRYLEGKTEITGYKYEPWHLRYMGSDATKIYESGLTLEEYYGFEG